VDFLLSPCLLLWTFCTVMAVDWFYCFFSSESGSRPLFTFTGPSGCCICFPPGGAGSWILHRGEVPPPFPQNRSVDSRVMSGLCPPASLKACSSAQSSFLVIPWPIISPEGSAAIFLPGAVPPKKQLPPFSPSWDNHMRAVE